MKKLLILLLLACSEPPREPEVWSRQYTELFFDNLSWKFYRNRRKIADLQSTTRFYQWRRLRKTRGRWDLIARSVDNRLVFGSMAPLPFDFASPATMSGEFQSSEQ